MLVLVVKYLCTVEEKCVK